VLALLSFLNLRIEIGEGASLSALKSFDFWEKEGMRVRS
jgi:hypothetical protein